MTEQTTADVRIERVYEAPIALVWQMWTDPDHFAAWYGPQGASIPVAEMDVRVGGRRFVAMEMTGPDGSTMRMHFVGEFTVVDEPTRLAYTEAMADADGVPTPDGPATKVNVTLETDGGETTRLVLVHVGVPAGSPGEMGWTMALDKLADQLR